MKKRFFLFTILIPIMVWGQEDYTLVQDVPYRDTTDAYCQERCKLDVYYPTRLTDVPVVVWFHGGGW